MIDDEHPIEFNIAYHPSPYPHGMREDLKEIGEVCDGIYLPVAESDLAYASNKIKYCIHIAHELNLVVIADFWGYGNLFACGAIPSLFTLRHPEHNCVDSNGKAIPKSCPNNPAVRAFLKDAIEEFIEKYRTDWLREKQRRDNEGERAPDIRRDVTGQIHRVNANHIGSRR